MDLNDRSNQSADLERIGNWLLIAFAIAFLISIVHYVDNTINYSEYPLSPERPDPPQWLVGSSWFLFTGLGIAGVFALRSGLYRRAALLFAGYSGSGLVGALHYSVAGTSEFPWWRHAHIVADFISGVVIVTLAVMLALNARDEPAPS